MTDDGVRPWGSYTVLAEGGLAEGGLAEGGPAGGPGYKVKTITVSPGHRLSYQRHSRRSEHWFVVAGEGDVTLDGQVVTVRPGEAVDVPVGVAHRAHNTGQDPLVFVEVQRGDYFGEDDIVRLDDDYGRGE